MEINTTYYLQTYFEFLKQCEEVFETDVFQSKNHTDQEHCGWTTKLYEAQDGFHTIEYTQTRLWLYGFNGAVGEGPTLQEAVADHKQKYDETYLVDCY